MTMLSLIALGLIIACAKACETKAGCPHCLQRYLINSLLLDWSDSYSSEEDERMESYFLVIHALIFHKSTRKWYTYLYLMMVGYDVIHFYWGNAVKLSLSKIIFGSVKRNYTLIINYITYVWGGIHFFAFLHFKIQGILRLTLHLVRSTNFLYYFFLYGD